MAPLVAEKPKRAPPLGGGYVKGAGGPREGATDKTSATGQGRAGTSGRVCWLRLPQARAETAGAIQPVQAQAAWASRHLPPACGLGAWCLMRCLVLRCKRGFTFTCSCPVLPCSCPVLPGPALLPPPIHLPPSLPPSLHPRTHRHDTNTTPPTLPRPRTRPRRPFSFSYIRGPQT